VASAHKVGKERDTLHQIFSDGSDLHAPALTGHDKSRAIAHSVGSTLCYHGACQAQTTNCKANGGQATLPTTREQVRINVGSWVIHVGLTVIVSPPLNPPTCRGHKSYNAKPACPTCPTAHATRSSVPCASTGNRMIARVKRGRGVLGVLVSASARIASQPNIGRRVNAGRGL
jgi:hypothetical protein